MVLPSCISVYTRRRTVPSGATFSSIGRSMVSRTFCLNFRKSEWETPLVELPPDADDLPDVDAAEQEVLLKHRPLRKS